MLTEGSTSHPLGGAVAFKRETPHGEEADVENSWCTSATLHKNTHHLCLGSSKRIIYDTWREEHTYLKVNMQWDWWIWENCYLPCIITRQHGQCWWVYWTSFLSQSLHTNFDTFMWDFSFCVVGDFTKLLYTQWNWPI